jgi:hypothetical protein
MTAPLNPPQAETVLGILQEVLERSMCTVTAETILEQVNS